MSESIYTPTASEVEVHYPVTVDAKTLEALMGTGDAIQRVSGPCAKPDRLEHWAKVKAILRAQAQASIPKDRPWPS